MTPEAINQHNFVFRPVLGKESSMHPNIPPPPGYVPGQTRVPLILGFTCYITIFALTLASMRFYVRHHMLHSVGLDDWFLLGATLILITIAVMSIWATTKGFGRHVYDVIMAGGDPVKDLFVVCPFSLPFPSQNLPLRLCAGKSLRRPGRGRNPPPLSWEHPALCINL